MSTYDLAVIGGGINGAGIARDAAGRGLSVLMIEKNDLASATSSASTKLIHGGLRYLEHYAFRLVRESLMERERLWAIAPHIVWPLRFVLPQMPGMRPAWMLRLGLFLYDHLGGREKLPATKSLDLTRDTAGAPLREGIRSGFEYSDLWVEDARLVVLNARDAQARGATILTRTAVTEARRVQQGDEAVWAIHARDSRTGEVTEHRARLLVNAAGPWAGLVTSGVMGLNTPARIRMVQGSHIVVPKLFDHGRAYIFQNGDGRIIFAIPYETDFTLIGTTDRDYQGDPSSVAISEAETITSAGRPRSISSSKSRGRTWSGPIPACVRFMMTAPRRRRKPRAITCCISKRRRPVPRASRSMAASSRPTGGCRTCAGKAGASSARTRPRQGRLDRARGPARREFPGRGFR